MVFVTESCEAGSAAQEGEAEVSGSVFPRGRLVAAAIGLSVAAALFSSALADGAAPVNVLLIGNSHLTGWGITEAADRFPAKLASVLAASGHPANVIDVGYRETSNDALRWVTKSKQGLTWLETPSRLAVILELGTNDCGTVSLDETRGNLDQILTVLAGKKIPMLIVGAAPYHDDCGSEYSQSFTRMFPELAKKYGATIYPDFKDGVTGHAELLQADGEHVNAAGDAVVVTRMLPLVEALIAKASNP
jgi:acyl-CoA thioesterase-1